MMFSSCHIVLFTSSASFPNPLAHAIKIPVDLCESKPILVNIINSRLAMATQ